MLSSVFESVLEISKHAGFYALTVQAIDKETADFYKHLEFEEYEDGDQPKLLYPLRKLKGLLEIG